MTRRVLVTGASGFVARALLRAGRAGFEYVAASRKVLQLDGIEWRRSPALSGTANWMSALEGIDAVVHLAGLAHLVTPGDSSTYFAENFEGTIKLARDAKEAGVRRFVFLSSAKVLGDESGVAPLSEAAPAQPRDPYAASKLAAEQGLGNLGNSLKISILRPPLVYGPNVKANFLALISAVARGVPLPLASIRNRRSLIGVDNLAAAIVACLESPAAAGRTYHVTDGPPVSTPELIMALSAALQRPPRLFPFPPRLLEAYGAIVGRAETVKRLTRSLELDDSAIRAELGWRAVRTFDAGIVQTVQWYRGLAEGGSNPKEAGTLR